jgi:hypothetical protein
MAIQSSNNSFSTISNITFGAEELKDTWWNVSNIDLPTISLSSPEMSNRAGSPYKGASDTCSYSDLTVTFIMDKDWKTFDEVYNFFLEGLDVETGKFTHYKKYDLWANMMNSDGEVVKKFWFYNCRLTDITGLSISPIDFDDTIITFSATFNILYFTYE